MINLTAYIKNIIEPKSRESNGMIVGVEQRVLNAIPLEPSTLEGIMGRFMLADEYSPFKQKYPTAVELSEHLGLGEFEVSDVLDRLTVSGQLHIFFNTEEMQTVYARRE